MTLSSFFTFISTTAGIIISAIVALVVGVVVVIAVHALLVRFRTSRGVIEKSKVKAEREAEEIVNRARQEAQHIVLQANEKASELLRSAQIFQTAAERELDRALREFIQKEIDRLNEAYTELVGSYHTMAEEAHQRYLSNMGIASKQMIEDAHQSAARTQTLLEEEVKRFHHAIDQRLSGWLQNVQKEIEEYKKEKIRQIDESIFRIIFRVSQEVLSKPIDLEEHQGLVIKALGEAKKEGFFAK